MGIRSIKLEEERKNDLVKTGVILFLSLASFDINVCGRRGRRLCFGGSSEDVRIRISQNIFTIIAEICRVFYCVCSEVL